MSFIDKEDLWAIADSGEPPMFTYNGAIDSDIISVLRKLEQKTLFMDDLATSLGLEKKYVEMIQHLLCGLGLCEYGTSPRGCWITDDGKKYIKFIDNN